MTLRSQNNSNNSYKCLPSTIPHWDRTGTQGQFSVLYPTGITNTLIVSSDAAALIAVNASAGPIGWRVILSGAGTSTAGCALQRADATTYDEGSPTAGDVYRTLVPATNLDDKRNASSEQMKLNLPLAAFPEHFHYVELTE